MQIPLQITFRHMDTSEAVEANIRERSQKLERFHDHITGCHVIIDEPDKHKTKGGVFDIHITITIPGDEIIVSRKHSDNHAHEDIYVTIRDAFNAARRQLESKLRISQKKVKTHETPPHGRVTELYPMMEYGRIMTPDGRDIYFHRNSLVNGDFEKLEEGSEVRFAEEMGDEGPQASSVHLIGKHHIEG